MDKMSRIKEYIDYVESLSEEDFVKHLIGVIGQENIVKIKEDEDEGEDEYEEG